MPNIDHILTTTIWLICLVYWLWKLESKDIIHKNAISSLEFRIKLLENRAASIEKHHSWTEVELQQVSRMLRERT